MKNSVLNVSFDFSADMDLEVVQSTKNELRQPNNTLNVPQIVNLDRSQTR